MTPECPALHVPVEVDREAPPSRRSGAVGEPERLGSIAAMTAVGSSLRLAVSRGFVRLAMITLAVALAIPTVLGKAFVAEGSTNALTEDWTAWTGLAAIVLIVAAYRLPRREPRR